MRKKAIAGSAEGWVLERQRRVGSVTPGGVGTGVLVGGQSSGRRKSGCGRQSTSQVEFCGGRVCTCFKGKTTLKTEPCTLILQH